jgi:hypothetical protein
VSSPLPRSYDPDDPAGATPLEYSWTCTERSGAVCEGVQLPAQAVVPITLSAPPAPAAGGTAAVRLVELTLRVTKGGRASVASTRVEVVTSAAPLPRVFITNPALAAAPPAPRDAVLNPQARLAFAARLVDEAAADAAATPAANSSSAGNQAQATTLLWTLSGTSGGRTVTVSLGGSSNTTSTGDASNGLAILPGVLNQSSTYTLRLSATR